MKCPHCGSDSTVVATRVFQVVMLKRKRKCFNEAHIFMTYEVHAGNLDRRTLPATLRGIEAAARSWSVRQRIMMNPGMTATQLSKLTGVSEARVRQVRASWGKPSNALLSGLEP